MMEYFQRKLMWYSVHVCIHEFSGQSGSCIESSYIASIASIYQFSSLSLAAVVCLG